MALIVKVSTIGNMGRTPIDLEELAAKVYYAPKGLILEDLAKYLNIHKGTLYKFKADNKDFNDAIKEYQRVSPIAVLNSLKKMAVGYSVEEETRERVGKGKKHKMVLTKTVNKHIQPNASAIIFYLKNKMPEDFKDKVEQVHSLGSDMETINFTAKRRE